MLTYDRDNTTSFTGGFLERILWRMLFSPFPSPVWKQLVKLLGLSVSILLCHRRAFSSSYKEKETSVQEHNFFLPQKTFIRWCKWNLQSWIYCGVILWIKRLIRRFVKSEVNPSVCFLFHKEREGNWVIGEVRFWHCTLRSDALSSAMRWFC